MDRPTNLVKAKDEVIGVDVMNNADEDLGCIKEVMLEKVEGQVRYVVLESGSILGLGGKLFAIPWNAIHFDAGKDCFRLNIDKEQLKDAPGFDKDHWPNMADQTYGKSLHQFYKTKPYWE